MKKSHSTLLRTLGVAHVVVAIILLPANLFIGFLTIPFVLPAQLWLFFLGLRLWRPDARIQSVLRFTHLVLAPFAILLIVYGAYALRTPTGGGHHGTFGLLPITLGACSGLLALWSLYVANYTRLDIATEPGLSSDLDQHAAQTAVTSNGSAQRKNLHAYIDGFVAAIPDKKKELYITQARTAAVVFKEHGALNVVECWGDAVADEDVTAFPLAVNCKADETLVFSWITWPSKEARHAGMKKVMADPRLSPDSKPLPFAGQRMIFGGFKMIVEE